ncbi:vanin-like protein 3 isoform X2 [Halyomorpha halys]|uniref:vanin-like protein 3 isoform X2 n=1 Tax=Halyomorpha halys TaxID=286706 RepID=UPI0006D4FAB1|nr:vanin-like protein 2 isoform X2 [Halyomorpha halys]
MDLLLFLILVSPVLAIKTDPREDFYHAAVVEYCPYEGKDGNDTMMRNAAEYVRLIQKAAETADILVFPEYGLCYEYENEFVEIPFGKNEPAPADNPNLHPVIRMLSKAARDNQIYVSINIMEKDLSTGEELTYNANIVFDRKGIVISKYRKFNLYYEKVNTTKVPDIAIFETDFCVRFGVFICADIFHKEPALTLVNEKNITDFIYPNWFYAELQLGLSVQIQFGWAYMTDSNLLSAGVTSLEQGSTGSGIFAGRKGTLINIINERNETRILTGKVLKKMRSNAEHCIIGNLEGRILKPLTPGFDSTHKIELGDFKNYGTHMLLPEVIWELSAGPDESFYLNKIMQPRMCQCSVCCDFYVNVTFTFKPLKYLNMSDISYLKNDSYYHYQYRFATFDGIKGFLDGGSKGIQVCAIIPCLDDSMASCGKKTGNAKPLQIHSQSYGDIFLYSTTFNKISIKSTPEEEIPDFTFPNILDSSKSSSLKAFGSPPDVSNLEFSSDERSSTLSYSTDRLIYAGLYSRIISRDGGKPSNYSASAYFPPYRPHSLFSA